MPKIIFTSRFIKGGSHGKNLVNYMATRDGVELPQVINGARPATENQTKLIAEVLRNLPQTAERFEYEDYAQSPTVANASAFISTVFEQNPELWSSVRNYVEYIARRPGAERSRVAGHGLWNGSDKPLAISRVADEVANHGGNIWTHVVSLRREDAERLGYNNVAMWRDLVTEKIPEIAQAMKIPMNDLRWYAAYHDKDTNPHIHLLVYSANPTRGYLTEPSIERMRSSFARSIFADEFMHIYERKDVARSELNTFADERLRELAASLDDGGNAELTAMLTELGAELQRAKGRKQYGYLKPALKQKVDDVVRRLAADSRIAEMYAHWCELTADVKRIYTGKPDAPLPLEHEKTFKTIRNMVIKHAIEAAAQAQLIELQDFTDDNYLPELEIAEADEPTLTDEPPEATVSLGEPDANDDAPLYSGNMWSAEYKAAREYLYGQGVEKDFARALELLAAEAELGNALALHDLGHMHQNGLGVDADLDEAEAWYARAYRAFCAAESAKPKPYLQYRIAKMHRDGLGTPQSYEATAEWFGRAADEGHQYAQYSLGGMYRRGQGVEQDDAEAFRFYTLSASRGNAYAAYELAGMHEKGVATAADSDAAQRYYEVAFGGFLAMETKGADDKLQYRLGKMLLDGKGAERDVARAADYFRKAAENKNAFAQYSLAKLILSGEVEGDHEDAIAWLTQSAEQGNEYAQYSLGKHYLTDEHRDVEQAVRWLAASAEQDNQFAQYALGKHYLSEEHRDAELAVRWLTASAEQGNEYAQYSLGKHYLTDEHCNTEIAVQWFTASAKQNNEYAQYALGKHYLTDEHRDTELAVRWLIASAEQCNQYAQYALGKMYLKGDGVAQDRELAREFFIAAAAQGNEYAQWFVDHMDDAPAPGVGELLRHLARMVRQDYAQQRTAYEYAVDRKLMAKIRRKKQELGQKFE